MTIKDLIGKGPYDLEKMSDEELQKWCEPFLRIAPHVEVERQQDEKGEIELVSAEERQENAIRQKQQRKKKSTDLMADMRKLAAIHGIDLDNLQTGIR